MKPISTLLFFFLFLTACMQNEAEFSCDPILNRYVSTHRTELAKLSLSSLTSSDLQLQQAVFRSYGPEKKRDIWLQKLQFLLNNENYTETEYVHVSKIPDHLHVGYFLEENLEFEIEMRTQFAHDWINYATDSLGWSDKQIAFVIYRLYTNQAQFDAELNTLSKIQTQVSTNSEENDMCNCNTSSSYCIDLCIAGICKTTTTGCGWLWSETCNGVCE